MNKKFKITATIVLYKENVSSLKKTIDSFLKTPISKKLFLIDNSPTDILITEFIHTDIEYIFVGKNIGFGNAHNIVLEKINSEFHLILNPDVTFTSNVITNLIKALKDELNTAFITPKVLYPNKEVQYVCRKHPTFLDLVNRKLKFSKNQIRNNEYQHKNLEEKFYPDFIHGCFMLFRTELFIGLKGFDKRYFLYMEDADICREIDKIGKRKLYYPDIYILHQHQKGSSKKLKLFFYHFSSAIKYFLKWGI